MQIFLSDFNQTSIFSADFRKSTQISNFMKILPVETELFQVEGRTEGQTDIKQLLVPFHNFAKAD